MGRQLQDALKAAGLLGPKKTEPQSARDGVAPIVASPIKETVVKAAWPPSWTERTHQVRPEQSRAPRKVGLGSEGRPVT
jgi:hypothetical protein